MNIYEYAKFEYVFMGGGNWVEYDLIHETDDVGTDDEVSYDVWVGANDEYINVWEGLGQAPYEMDVIPDPDMSWYLLDESETALIPDVYVGCYFRYMANKRNKGYLGEKYFELR